MCLMCNTRVTTAQSIITKVNKSLYVIIGTSPFRNTRRLTYRPFGSLGKYIMLSRFRDVHVIIFLLFYVYSFLYSAIYREIFSCRVADKFSSNSSGTTKHVILLQYLLLHYLKHIPQVVYPCASSSDIDALDVA